MKDSKEVGSQGGSIGPRKPGKEGQPGLGLDRDPREQKKTLATEHADRVRDDVYIGGPDGVKQIEEELKGLRNPATAPVVLTEEEIKRRELIEGFKSHSADSQPKKSWTKNPFVRWGTALAIAATSIFGGKAILDNTVNKPPEISSTYNNSAEVNNIKAGINGNAVPATQEQIKAILDQIPPVLTKPENGGTAPKVKMLLPFNPEGAENIEIKTETLLSKDGNNTSYKMYDIRLTAQNLPLSASLVEGAKSVKAKASSDGFRTEGLTLDYVLRDGRQLRAYVNFADNNFVLNKEIPTYITSGDTNKDDLTPVREFDFNQDPFAELLRISGSTHFGIIFRTPLNTDNFAISPTFITGPDSRILYPPTTVSQP